MTATQMTIEDKEGRYNQAEKERMHQIIHWMLNNSCIETHVEIGKKQVRFRRPNVNDTTVSIDEMVNTLAHNERNVTAFNKRPKKGASPA